MPTPPPDAYVPWGVFEWLMGVFGTTLAVFWGGFLWVFKRHLADDTERENATVARLIMREKDIQDEFKVQEALIEKRHAENQAKNEGLRSEMAKGNEASLIQTNAMRRE